MNGASFKASAWYGGQRLSSGAGYGLRICRIDRDRFFRTEWSDVTLNLQGSAESLKVNISTSLLATMFRTTKQGNRTLVHPKQFCNLGERQSASISHDAEGRAGFRRRTILSSRGLGARPLSR